MAIEAMTYELFQLYLKELPRSAMTKWTPKQVMDELLAIDPYADRSKVLRMGKQSAKGVAATDMSIQAEDKRFRAKWAHKAHNGLGSFLHTSTITQRAKGRSQTEAAARAKCIEIIAELEEFVTTAYSRFTLADFISVDCDCGVTFKRRASVLEENPVVECGGCGAYYDYVPNPDGGGVFRLQQARWVCSGCGIEQGMGWHRLESLPQLVCSCGLEGQVTQQYVLCR